MCGPSFRHQAYFKNQGYEMNMNALISVMMSFELSYIRLVICEMN